MNDDIANVPIEAEDMGRRALWLRRGKVVGALALAGAGVGAVVGTVLLATTLGTGPGGVSRYDWPLGLVLGGPFGAADGAIAAPVLGFAVLRRVPLGFAFGYGALGTLIGGWLGLAVIGRPVMGGLFGFLAGLAVARVHTWWRNRPLTRSPRVNAE